MRYGLCLLSLTLTLAVQAQSEPTLAEITTDRVILRSGPSERMAGTGELFAGTRVVIDHEEPGGWLAIEPPPGQISWICHRNLGPIDPTQLSLGDSLPRNAVVHAEPFAELAYGQAGLSEPLEVRRTKIPDQTIVLVIGRKVKHRDTFWYPIEPPAEDFRYIPKSSITPLTQSGSSFVVRSPNSEVRDLGTVTASASEPTATVSATPVNRTDSDWPSHPLWKQAEDAARNQEFDRAEMLYLRLAGEMNKPGGDTDLANLCYTRIHSIREQQRGMPARPASTATIVKEADPIPTPTTASNTGMARWLGPGYLRVAGFMIADRKTYALVDDRDRVLCYALSSPKVDLDRYRGYRIELYGSITYPGDLRGAGIMTATGVRLKH